MSPSDRRRSRQPRQSIAAVLAVCLATLIGCGSSGATSSPASSPATACVSPGSLNRSARLVPAHASLQARLGALLYVSLVQPERLTTPRDPHTSPWLAVSSQPLGILTPQRLCAGRRTSTLRTKLTVFRATRAGRASLVAAVAPAWRRIPGRPRAYVASVVVR